MTTRHLVGASLVTGLGLVVLSIIGLSDPTYYDPQAVLDYAASILAIALFLGVAYTLVVWYRVTPVRRAALLLRVPQLVTPSGALAIPSRRSAGSRWASPSTSSGQPAPSC